MPRGYAPVYVVCLTFYHDERESKPNWYYSNVNMIMILNLQGDEFMTEDTAQEKHNDDDALKILSIRINGRIPVSAFRYARLIVGMDISDVATSVGITPDCLCNYEEKPCEIPASVALKLSRFLGMSIDNIKFK